MGGEGHAEPVAVSFQAIVDRGEGEIVMLLVHKEQEAERISFPRRLLPPGAHEGSVLRVTIEDRPDEEAAARARVEGLLNRLLQAGRGPTTGPGLPPPTAGASDQGAGSAGLPDSGPPE